MKNFIHTKFNHKHRSYKGQEEANFQGYREAVTRSAAEFSITKLFQNERTLGR